MKHYIRWSYLAVAGVVALGGCSGGADGDAAGDPGASRDLARDMSAEPGDGDPGDGDPGEPTRTQSEAEALQSDLEAIADAQGWTLDEARLYQAKSDATDDVGQQIDTEYPGVRVGSAIGPEPGDAPRVYIKGPADAGVQEIAAAAPFEIVIIDRQPFSRDEIDERQSMLSAELLRLGFQNFAVSTDIEREALMEATVERAAGAPDSEDEILAALPAALREPTRIVLMDDFGVDYE